MIGDERSASRSTLDGDRTADVCVVGAGIAGLSVAYQAARAWVVRCGGAGRRQDRQRRDVAHHRPRLECVLTIVTLSSVSGRRARAPARGRESHFAVAIDEIERTPAEDIDRLPVRADRRLPVRAARRSAPTCSSGRSSPAIAPVCLTWRGSTARPDPVRDRACLCFAPGCVPPAAIPQRARCAP